LNRRQKTLLPVHQSHRRQPLSSVGHAIISAKDLHFVYREAPATGAGPPGISPTIAGAASNNLSQAA
jgi:hypothetical protein